MKFLTRCLCICILMTAGIAAAQTPAQPQTASWWREQAPGAWPFRLNAKKLPLVSVKGNKFVDSNGNTMLFRGLSISDPDKLEMQGHWLDGLVLRSGVGTDAHPELELRAHPLGRVRQGGHARRDQMTATT